MVKLLLAISIAIAAGALTAYAAGVRVMLLRGELMLWWMTSSDNEFGPSTSAVMVPYGALVALGAIVSGAACIAFWQRRG